MKLQFNEKPVISTGFSTDSIKAGIKQENLGLVFKMLSKSLYKDPIGSIIRELCSNAYDACIEAGKKPAVIVSYNSEDRSLSITDFGVGMDKDFIINNYSFYGNSTKQQSEDQFGMWGIGSKSVFSLTNSFTIDTVKDGVNLVYLCSLGEEINAIPELDLIAEMSTDKPSGTTIKFGVEELEYPERSIREAISEQLNFFDCVVVKGLPGFVWKPNIIKHKNFIVNTENSQTRPTICLGKVSYPIPHKLLRGTFLNNFRIGIYFDLNSGLKPTPSREEIKIDDKTFSIIEKGIKEVEKEFLEFYKQQHQYDTFADLVFNSDKYVVIDNISYYIDESYLNPKFLSIKDKKHFDLQSVLNSIYYIKSSMEREFLNIKKGSSNNKTYWSNHKSFPATKSKILKIGVLYYGFRYEISESHISKLACYLYGVQNLTVKGLHYSAHKNPNIDINSEISQFIVEFIEAVKKSCVGNYEEEFAKLTPSLNLSKSRKVSSIDKVFISDLKGVKTEVFIDTLVNVKYLVYFSNDNNSNTKWVKNHFLSNYHIVYGKPLDERFIKFIVLTKAELVKLHNLPNLFHITEFQEKEIYKQILNKFKLYYNNRRTLLNLGNYKIKYSTDYYKKPYILFKNRTINKFYEKYVKDITLNDYYFAGDREIQKLINPETNINKLLLGFYRKRVKTLMKRLNE